MFGMLQEFVQKSIYVVVFYAQSSPHDTAYQHIQSSCIGTCKWFVCEQPCLDIKFASPMQFGLFSPGVSIIFIIFVISDSVKYCHGNIFDWFSWLCISLFWKHEAYKRLRGLSCSCACGHQHRNPVMDNHTTFT